jgi:transcriptional regulator
MMVERFEHGWTMQDADPEYIARMERGIVGVEIAVTSAMGKYKLSQNRSAEDRERVIHALGDAPLAAAMRRLAETEK